MESVEDSGTSGSTLAQGSAILVVAFLISVVFRYGFVFSLGRLFSPSKYGMFGVGEAILNILLLVISGSFPWVATKYLSTRRSGVIKASLLGNFLLAIAGCSLLYWGFISGAFDLGESYYSIILVVIAYILVAALANVYLGALQGAFKFKKIGIIRIVTLITLVGAGLVLALSGFGAPGAIAGYIFSALIMLGLGIYWSRDLKPWSGKLLDKEIYSLAVPLFIGILGVQLLMSIDILGVKFFSTTALSDTLSGYYKAVIVWARPPVFITLAMMGAFFPFISRYAADRNMVRNYTSKFIKYAFIFLFPLSLIMSIISSKALTIIYPQAYAQGGSALTILSIGMFLLVLITIIATVFQATHRPGLPALILGPMVALQIILLFLFVPKYELAGAAMATTISCALGLLFLGIIYVRSYGSGFNFSQVGKIALAALLTIGFLKVFPMPNKILVLISMAASYILYLFFMAVLRLFTATDAEFVFSGAMFHNHRLVEKAIKLVAGLNRIGGRH